MLSVKASLLLYDATPSSGPNKYEQYVCTESTCVEACSLSSSHLFLTSAIPAAACRCMGWGPDEAGRNGVWLNKDVPKHAAHALGICLQTLAPRIMTWGQYAQAAQHVLQQQLRNPGQSFAYCMEDFKLNFGLCVDHFALHAGGYGVLKGLQKAMDLPVDKVLPSFATLMYYGNTSCSTTWYTMGYLESVPGGIKKGEKIMQVGLGGGMKAGVNIWQAVRDNRYVHLAWDHVAERPVRDEDLPRRIEDPASTAAAEEAH